MPDSDTLTSEVLISITADLAKGPKVLAPRSFQAFAKERRTTWGVPAQWSVGKLLSELEKSDVIRTVELKSDQYRSKSRLAVLSLKPDALDYAVSLRGGAYLSHVSAAFLLGLTEQLPRVVFVNREQTPKPTPTGPMTQEGIDRAFSRSQRQSNYRFRVADHEIVLLSGKHTGNAGVVTHPERGLLVTGLERTLIDVAVRPRYAGGVFQVAQAFANAANDVNVSNLVSLLDALAYRYPYHQAIGFYLERAGFTEDALRPLRELGAEFDFYLDYSMASPVLDPSWRVFFPAGM